MRELSSVSDHDELLAGPLPVLLAFVAEGCGPCLQQRPVLEELARTRAGELAAAYVDVDALPALRDRYHVTGLPTVVLVESGEVKVALSGVRTTRQLLEGLGATPV